MTGKPSDWLSISAYARAWGLGRSTVLKMVKAGALEMYRLKRPHVDVVRIRNVGPNDHRPLESNTSHRSPNG